MKNNSKNQSAAKGNPFAALGKSAIFKRDPFAELNNLNVLKPNLPELRSEKNADTNYGRITLPKTRLETVPDVDALKNTMLAAQRERSNLITAASRAGGLAGSSVYKQRMERAEKALEKATKEYEAAVPIKNAAIRSNDASSRATKIAELESVIGKEPQTLMEKLSDRGYAANVTQGKAKNKKFFAPMDNSKGTNIYFGGEAQRHRKINYMTPEEQDVYAYYLAKDEMKAKDYFDNLSTELNQRMQQDNSEKVQRLSEEHPSLGVGYNITGSFAAPMALVGTAGHVVGDALSGNETPIDSNSTAFAGTHMVRDSAEGIKANTNSSLGKFLIDTGLSMGQFISKIPLGPLALPLMASGAGGQAALDTTERGGTAEQALKMGLTAAAAEFVTEKMSLDSLTDIFKLGGKGFKNAFAATAHNIGKQAGTEFFEELSSEYINNIGDKMIMGQQSEMNTYVQELVSRGMSEEEALRKASLQFWILNPLASGAGGALSGGIMGGASGANYALQQTAADNKTGAALRDFGGELAVSEAINLNDGSKLAEKASAKLASGKDVSNRRLGQLYRSASEGQRAEVEAYFRGDNSGFKLQKNAEGNTVLPTGAELRDLEMRRTQNAHAEKLAKSLRDFGIKNIVVENMPEGESGRFENGVVFISGKLDTARAINAKIAHEISHAAQEGDAAFSGDIIDTMRELSRDVDSAIAAKLEIYSRFFMEQGKDSQWIADTITEDYAADEVAADFIGELMENDELLKSLGKKPNIVQRVFGAIERLVYSGSNAEQEQYLRLASRLRELAGAGGEATGIDATEKARYNGEHNKRYSLDDESFRPWDETAAQAAGAGYPEIDGKQVFPFKTWVRDKDIGNYGLIVGRGNDDELNGPVLVVSFWNKEKSTRAKVELPAARLENVSGGYQPSDAELTALFETEPADKLRNAVSAEEWEEYRDLWDTANDIKAGIVVDLSTDNLPAKAANYTKKVENRASKLIGRLLDVPNYGISEIIKPLIHDISNEYLSHGTVSNETFDNLFEVAWDNGVIYNDEFLREYYDLKDTLKNTAITISEGDSGDIADYESFRRHQFGRLHIVKKGGTPIDVLYMELAENYGNLFPESITHPADQLRQMAEVARSIAVVEESHDKYYGGQAEVMKEDARYEFDTAMNNHVSELATVRKYYEHRAKQETERARVKEFAGQTLSASDIDTIKLIWEKGKELGRKLDYTKAKNLMTPYDNGVVERVVRGEISLSTLPEDCNASGVTAIYNATKDYNDAMKELNTFNRNRKTALRYEADDLIGSTVEWKDKTAGWKYSRETMERNIYDIAPDKASATGIIERYFAPVHRNEAESTRLKNFYRERVNALNLNRKVHKGDKISEAAAVQLYGEALDNIEVLEKKARKNPEDDWRNGHSLDEWRSIRRDMLDSNPSLDMNKISASVDEFHKIYNELFEQMNEARIRNGYEPVDYRRGYFPHFQNEQNDGIMAKFGRALGIKMNVDELPTTINGLTHTFKPGIKWMGSALKREGFATSYDAVEGFDRYIEGICDVISHTDDIQSLRAFAEQIRYRSGDEGLREQIDNVREDKSLGLLEKEDKIRAIYENGKFELSNFVVDLEAYINALAGKKSLEDRPMEYAAGRRTYDVMKWLEEQVAANMVAVNPGSWLTNFIPLVQGGAQLKQRELLSGMWDTLKAYKSDDGFANSSSFLTNRRGSDPIVKTWRQNASGIMSSPMSVIDNFVADSLVRAREKHNLDAGMVESVAMDEADAWTASVMADRSKGSLPTIFNQRNPLTKLFTQFQVEVNNQLSYLFKDLPREQKEKGMAALVAALLKFFFGSWMFNEIYEYFVGRRPALDPIGILNETVGDFTGYELPNLVDAAVDVSQGREPDFASKKLGNAKAGANLAKNVVEELPFIGGFIGGGRLPISSAIPNIGKVWGGAANLMSGEGSAAKNWDAIGKEIIKPVAYVLPPFGGGQLKKMAQGIRTVTEQGRFGIDSKGEDVLQYPVFNDNPVKTGLNAAQAAIFGPTALKSGREWIENGFSSLSSKDTAVYKSLIESGTSARSAFDIIAKLKAAEKTEDASKTDAQRTILMDAKLDDKQKRIIYEGKISDKHGEKIDGIIASGMNFNQFLEVSNIFAKVNDTEVEKNSTKPSKFIGELVDAGFDNKQITSIGEIFKFWSMAPNTSTIGKFNKLTDDGVSAEKAADVVEMLAELEPADGDKVVSDLQKLQKIENLPFNEKDMLAAARAAVSESTFKKVKLTTDFGISIRTFTKFQTVLPRFNTDGNGSYKQSEVKAALDSMSDLSAEQKAVLWQSQGSSWSAKNNPYSSSIGSEVKAAADTIKAATQKQDTGAGKSGDPFAAIGGNNVSQAVPSATPASTPKGNPFAALG